MLWSVCFWSRHTDQADQFVVDATFGKDREVSLLPYFSHTFLEIITLVFNARVHFMCKIRWDFIY